MADGTGASGAATITGGGAADPGTGAATGSTTAATGATAASGAGNGAGAAAQWWGASADYGLDADTQGWLQSEGFNNFPDVNKALPELVKSYRNAKGMVGRDKVVWPKDDGDKAAWAEIHKRMGVPGSWQDYGLVPTGPDGQPVEGADPSYANAMAQAMHEAGIPKAAAQKMAAKNMEFMRAHQEQARATMARQHAAEHDQTMKEWGPEADTKLAATQHAYRALGMDEATLNKLENAMGTKWLLNHMSTLGAAMAEDRGHQTGGTGGGGFMTPEGAGARKQELMKDSEWVAKYSKGDSMAVAEWNKLEQIQAAGMGPRR